MIPQSDDGDTYKGCVDVWVGLSDDAWETFSDPTNFGKDFEGVKGLNRDMLKDCRSMITEVVASLAETLETWRQLQ